MAFLNANLTLDVLPRVIGIMAEELGWSDERKKRECVTIDNRTPERLLHANVALTYLYDHRYEATKRFLHTMGLEDINTRGTFNSMDILHYRY